MFAWGAATLGLPPSAMIIGIDEALEEAVNWAWLSYRGRFLLATVFWLMPWRLASAPKAPLTMLFRSTDRRSRAGAPV